MQHYKEELRTSIVKVMIRIQEQFQEIRRNCLFLAVSILDLFFKNIHHHIQMCCQGDWRVIGVGCLMIAWKFIGGTHPTLSAIQTHLAIHTLPSIFTTSLITTQQKILQAIDYQIPHTTAYDTLNSIITQQQLQDETERRDITRSLKILLTAIQIGNQLSFEPELGEKIHRITKKISNTTAVDRKAKNLYRKCVKVIQGHDVSGRNMGKEVGKEMGKEMGDSVRVC